MSPAKKKIDAKTFGTLMAKAIVANPYSSNWALVQRALEIGGQEVDDIEEIPELVNRLAKTELR